MNDCKRCHGAGYLYIKRGDNDHTCPDCGGSGDEPTPPANMVAVAEPLSVEVQVRLELATLEQLHDDRVLIGTRYSVARYNEAEKVITYQLPAKLHALFDALDAARAENARLKIAITDLQTENDLLADGFYDD